MARTRVKAIPAPLAVFAGGTVGGALRLAIDALVPPVGPAIPVGIVTINVVGALLLGAMTAWVTQHGHRPWVPMVGTGALGAFTTFSTLVALPWVTHASAVVAIGVVVGTLAGAIGAAALGWWLGLRLPPPASVPEGGAGPAGDHS